jgi:hypothetical protein
MNSFLRLRKLRAAIANLFGAQPCKAASKPLFEGLEQRTLLAVTGVNLSVSDSYLYEGSGENSDTTAWIDVQDDGYNSGDIYWSIDWGDGSSDTFGANDSMSHVYADGDATYTISATCTDDDGSYQTSTSVLVKNVAPTLAGTGSTVSDPEGYNTISLTKVYDPGVDTITHWEINWGDGTSTVVSGESVSTDHFYVTPGEYTAIATAFDEDGSYQTSVAQVKRLITVEVSDRNQPGGNPTQRKQLNGNTTFTAISTTFADDGSNAAGTCTLVWSATTGAGAPAAGFTVSFTQIAGGPTWEVTINGGGNLPGAYNILVSVKGQLAPIATIYVQI